MRHRLRLVAPTLRCFPSKHTEALRKVIEALIDALIQALVEALVEALNQRTETRIRRQGPRLEIGPRDEGGQSELVWWTRMERPLSITPRNAPQRPMNRRSPPPI